ncbi:universal stress protein [Nocardioides humilatus]|nr:universal stress protein [Nocardioides humilatus]
MTKIQPGSIVVGADGSPEADRAVQWAAEQAAFERRPLVVLSACVEAPALVAASMGAAYACSTDDLFVAAQSTASAAAELAIHHRSGLPVETLAVMTDPRIALIEAAESAHLVVLGSRGHGPITSKLLGSVGATVMKRAACPVVVCRPGTELRVKRGVIVGADATAESLPIIDFAFRQASLRSQPLTILHTYLDETYEHASRIAVAESIAGFREHYPEVAVAAHTTQGFAAAALSAIADRHDLVVIGRHPIDSVARHIVGAISTAVLERAHTTIAIVPEAATALAR